MHRLSDKSKKEHKIRQVAQVAHLLSTLAQLNAKSAFLDQKRNLSILVAQQVAQINISKKKKNTFTPAHKVAQPEQPALTYLFSYTCAAHLLEQLTEQPDFYQLFIVLDFQYQHRAYNHNLICVNDIHRKDVFLL